MVFVPCSVVPLFLVPCSLFLVRLFLRFLGKLVFLVPLFCCSVAPCTSFLVPLFLIFLWMLPVSCSVVLGDVEAPFFRRENALLVPCSVGSEVLGDAEAPDFRRERHERACYIWSLPDVASMFSRV